MTDKIIVLDDDAVHTYSHHTVPFASAKKEAHVLHVENEKLFEEANRSKTFVYINELCTVLRQHGDKKRQSLSKPEPSTSKTPSQLSSGLPKATKAKANDKEEQEEQPSTSGVNEDAESNRKTVRKSRKQIAYLENLLKVYNDEIRRLQEADLSLDDLKAEDSLYIQEHKLKRKMMKIYEKLCEIKNCNTLTGRVLEQRISYSGSRFPEINKRVSKFINSPEAQENPPDYPDIYQQVVRANERYNLCLPRKRLAEIAKEAFRDTASRIQDRRHLDLVYNFGSHLTDSYKPTADPALGDPTLLKKLRSNRELARNRLDEVISKYASKQEDTEEQERMKRVGKDKSNKEGNTSRNRKNTEVNGVEEEEEAEEENPEEEEEPDEEDDEDDQSSDPDIEEEIQASTQLAEADGASEDEEETNEAEQAFDDADKDQLPPSVSASEKDEEDISDLSPMSQQSKSLLTPFSTSPQDSPSQSEPAPSDEQRPVSNGSVNSAKQEEIMIVHVKGKSTKDSETVSENGVKVVQCETSSTTSTLNETRTTRAQKRKREEATPVKSKQVITRDNDPDIPLDMGVTDSPPRPRAETPPYVSSSQSTPPPKKNKVNVATQCDPLEVIELSDSE
ncbi:hypothetical protein WMY93_020188 [Mugilogobius chulae]|uniref:Death domain-associated protein 6 n=1 Tax=Mugilogobius chulae TaxID=88201 RepID=A0AAW0NRN4_9GOBI